MGTTTKKLAEYIPKIEDGIPIPPVTPTVYTKKIAAGVLMRIADQIKPGQSVKLPVGSIGKFKKRVKERGLEIVQRAGQSDTETRVWVVDPRNQTGDYR